jgi:integrase
MFDPLSQRFRKLLKMLGINGRRGLGFYTLRHVFETIGGESRDQVAVNAIMGHVDSSMAGVYRERISDERLRAVTDTVREWLFGSE